ncbi:magnesium transporter MgtE N-terminal domain-containing protein [Micrococcoides hystricis]|uniref:Magnesium transporter MgtE N-terminal domain-containing protein n=1 Tax=Micrococcoides hystricis TaxID=1572761 RepID=A0ABV6P8C7_9MICC
MSSKIFAGRLLGLDVFDPLGDRLGRVRDLVVHEQGIHSPPQLTGLLVEVPGKKRVFVPMTRITSMDSRQVISTGLINLRRFAKRGSEKLVAAELFDRRITLREDPTLTAHIEDVGLAQTTRSDWQIAEFYAAISAPKSRSVTRKLVSFDEIRWYSDELAQPASRFLAQHQDAKATELADAIYELGEKRRLEIAEAMQDDQLADVLQELPDDDQVEILSQLAPERAADVLEEMDPDDAADLLNELADHQQQELLNLMEPDEAKDVLRLMEYDENTAGSIMTPVPVILSPEATVAEAMAHVRKEDLTPAQAASVYVCRPPLETPTGRYLGVVHIQQLLRHAPPEQLGSIMDTDFEPVSDQTELAVVTRLLAAYNLTSLPVVNDSGRLVGACTVDDVLDHLLPDDWRVAHNR